MTPAHISQNRPQTFPLMVTYVKGGFPSPADDYVDSQIDLNTLLVKHPNATFFVRVDGDSMTGAGIISGDIAIVDRSLKARSGNIVVAVVNGEFTMKRLKMANGKILLVSENPDMPPIEIGPEMQFEVWGVVTYVLHQVS